jgi:hypothetical protein
MKSGIAGIVLQGIGLYPLASFVLTGETASAEVWRACAVVALAGVLMFAFGLARELSRLRR